MRGAEAVAEILRREGVEQIFCFPFTPILDAVAAAGIRPIVARQERVAENIADGLSRTSGGRRVGVVTVQQSAGVENGFAGIAQAFTDSSPVLFLPGHPGSQLRGVTPTFDALEPYRSITKWSAMVPSAAALPSRFRQAFSRLRTGRPRPVMLEIPLDVAFQELEGELEYEPVGGARSAADPTDVAAAARLLAEAERPMIWAGQGVLYSGATVELRRLSERLAIPVMTTLLGKSAFDERHPLSLGTGAYSLTAAVWEELRRCDVLFAIGASLARDFTAPAIPEGKRLIHCTLDPTDLNVARQAEVALVGDARLTLSQLLEELADSAPVEGAETRARLAATKQRWAQRWQPKLENDDKPIDPYRVIGELMSTFDPSTTIVTHDSGSPRDQLVPLYEATVPHSYLGWGHSTQLGFGLGAAMGAKLAHPDRLVVNLMGDAAFGMVGLDVETAAREQIPILTVLLNNSAMGNYQRFIPRATKRYGTKFLSGSYADVAHALGAWSIRVEEPGAVRSALEQAAEQTREGRPALVEVITSEQPDIPYAPWFDAEWLDGS